MSASATQPVPVAVCDIRPSPENDALYARPANDSAAFRSLVESIREKGILQPLILTSDRVVVSGHRRLAAAKLVFGFGRKALVPCQILDKARADYTADEWVVLLREHNRSRVKTLDEVIREEAVSADPEAAYEALLDERKGRQLPELGLALQRQNILAHTEPLGYATPVD